MWSGSSGNVHYINNDLLMRYARIMAENKKNIKVVRSDKLSKNYEDRFVVVIADKG